MTILQGTMQDGTVLPVQVNAQGQLVAEGLPGPVGPQGPMGPIASADAIGPISVKVRVTRGVVTIDGSGMGMVSLPGVDWSRSEVLLYGMGSGDSAFPTEFSSLGFNAKRVPGQYSQQNTIHWRVTEWL